MEYTVNKLAKLSGVSTRTLRYYDQIGLLSPVRLSSSGYRIYGQAEVDTLQQILFYREMGMPLADIADAIGGKDFDRIRSLRSHLQLLEARKLQTEHMIATVRKTIQKEMGVTQMTDREKFECFKEKLVQENEEKYGEELREKYGEDEIRESNRKMMNLSQEDYQQLETLATEIQEKLVEAVQSGAAPSGEPAQEIVQLHKKWLSFSWPKYSAQAHRGLGEMYVADERFTAYYDGKQVGCAQFLRDAINCWVK